MKLIAWDTSSKAGALVALEWQPGKTSGERFQIKSEWTLNLDAAQHSERLLWAIHQMLQACSWKLEDIDVFGVGVGPGSFTGLRIGITTARTLAHTMGKPLVGVSSLAALARPVAIHFNQSSKKTLVLAASDAAKGEVFAIWGLAKSMQDCVAMADQDFQGLWKNGVEEEVITPETLLHSAQKKMKTCDQWVRIGEAKNRYEEQIWKKLSPSQEVDCPLPSSDHVQGKYLGVLVWEAYQAGLARTALEVHPRYLRASDAEKKLKAGLLGKKGS
jgi:tRNA threonylcarbamoyladenosine biosynthesis protein TsaB